MKTSVSSLSALPGIAGRRVLTSDGLRPARLGFNGDRVAPGAGATPLLDAGDLLVLPGIIDLHGDAFERAIMPRPGVTFPYDSALHDVDRQLLANGITTEFHGVTLSWEGGLRGEPYAMRMFDALDRMRATLGARHNVHLRFETHHVGGVDIAREWIQAGKVQFLALNDHLPSMAKRLGNDRKLLQYAERAECDLDTFQDRIRAAMACADEVANAMRELTESAKQAGLEVASHDDPDSATRRYYHQLGCRIAEFPLTTEVAHVARELDDFTVFGGPNVVRGRSHTNAPNATEMIRAGLCDILTSDYYYPAPLAAVMKLVADGVLPLSQAWALVSRNPARAAGLRDQGTLDAGMLADAIVVDDSVPGVPRVCAAIVGGRLRYAAQQFDTEQLQQAQAA
ncbi:MULTISPECIES: alpha-D-ribose 1-methylphosphonate 5-triphosphate diphosphatase [unclassified Achromobacter]|uniref:alpha-D-ribose 1-methylphosphonate 5-triphosphate diphosphatase n=1 Tax=unclassified Achromobacter TaxID=2626865 RepID=UPI000B51C2AD|nr:MULTISPECIES: alpha-D-ribose 1-methylphosphonate 5-triphosphate diphosphatase [unclassified Achromobacter]OWT75315.1 alpha-D-ribose 1-methylphosphonate 5-triphosphate diphosphatase [Achromobacter sp. HZ28]OWT75974.1 alpha-D-ribose 1-methylphosphonate 5-triphosphate diphosphatase [Achromobacter sp. HZ34]